MKHLVLFLRKTLAVCCWLACALFVAAAVSCFTTGLREFDLIVMIGSTALSLLVALIALAIGVFSWCPGEWSKAIADSAKADPAAAAADVSTPEPIEASDDEKPDTTRQARDAAEPPQPAERDETLDEETPSPDETAETTEATETAADRALASNHRNLSQIKPYTAPTSANVRIATPEPDTPDKHIYGSYVGKIYIYDPKRLRKIKEGREFTVTIVTRDVTMHSKITGEPWNSRRNDGYAVEVNGKPFGVIFNTIACNCIRTLFDKGARHVTLTAMREGWYTRDIPEVYVMLPTLEEAREQETGDLVLRDYRMRESLGFAARIPDRSIRIGRKIWQRAEDVPEDGYAAYTATVEQAPTPEGSTAKPHIRLLSNGALLADISARSSTLYPVFTGLVDHDIELLVSRDWLDFKAEIYTN